MSFAVCISCGATKKDPFATCNNCGFSPKRDVVAMAKSLMLSTAFTSGDGRAIYSLEVLQEVQKTIQEGSEPQFDLPRLAELIAQKTVLGESSPPTAKVILFILAVFSVPAALFLVALIFGHLH